MKCVGNGFRQRIGLVRLLLATIIMMFAVPVLASGGMGSDCKLIGSWIGYDANGAAWWMTTADGQNASHGTLNLEAPGSVLFFPGAVAGTELRGVWEKTGGNTYDWTVVGFSYDEFTTTKFIARLSGKDVISKDCNTLYVKNVVMEVFLPFDDLNTATPIIVQPFPDHEGYRIKLHLPELP